MDMKDKNEDHMLLKNEEDVGDCAEPVLPVNHTLVLWVKLSPE